MPIIGGMISRVEAKKKEENSIEGFDYNFAMESVSVDKNVLKIRYASKVEYKPNVAEITVEGEMYWQDEEKKVKQYAEEFKKNKKLPTEIIEQIVEGMQYSTQAVGTLAAFGLNIAAPLNIPRTKIAPPGAQSPTQQPPQAAKGQAG